MAPDNNTRRWGADDELGAANLVTDAVTLSALSIPRDGRVISLAQPLGRDTPHPPHRLAVRRFTDRDGSEPRRRGEVDDRLRFAEDTILLPTHSGTHVDALAHVWYDDSMYGGHPATSMRGALGATRCGIEKLPPLVTRGIFLDAVTHRGRPLLPGATIDLDELQAIAQAQGVMPQPGDAVLIRTGWLESALSRRDVDYTGEPGIDLSAAHWLAELDVAAIGADNFAVEALPAPDGSRFPVHRLALRDYGIPLIEGVVLDVLARTLKSSFLFVLAPLPITGGTASPVTPLAIV